MPEVEYLYRAEEDLYRLGNATTPKLDHLRTEKNQMMDVYSQNWLSMVKANGRGVNLLTEAGVASRRDAWLWIIPKYTPILPGLALHRDATDKYHLCPAFDMTLNGYRALLARLALRCIRMRKV